MAKIEQKAKVNSATSRAMAKKATAKATANSGIKVPKSGGKNGLPKVDHRIKPKANDDSFQSNGLQKAPDSSAKRGMHVGSAGASLASRTAALRKGGSRTSSAKAFGTTLLNKLAKATTDVEVRAVVAEYREMAASAAGNSVQGANGIYATSSTIARAKGAIS